MEKQNRAVFLDRDGTLNEEMGYINHISRFRVFDFVPEAIKLLNEAGFKVIVVTNQSGLARGYFDEKLLSDVHQTLIEKTEASSAKIDKIYYCPHHPIEGKGNYKKNCDCRKPKTGMLDLAKKEFNLDLKKSFMIGDRYKDVQFGKKAGLRSFMVLTGYGIGEYTYQRSAWDEEPEHIFKDLLEAANFIVNSLR